MPASGERPIGSGVHSATAVGRAPSYERRRARKNTVAALSASIAVTMVSAIFIVAFIAGLHAPGPRSVPVGLVGPPAQASRANAALGHQAPGAFTISSYPSSGAARSAIFDRTIDAALVPGPTIQHLLVATAVSEAETRAIITAVHEGAARARVPLIVSNIRPLHSGDPQGLAQLYFVIALLAPSLAFGNLLINRLGAKLSVFEQLLHLVVYSVVVSAVATAIADAGIGALTGAPWAVFGIGALMAFAVAVVGAAATRWTGMIGYVVILLLFVPVGISSSGTTLGPHMITPWYADLGMALPVGSAQPAVRNVTYFNGNAIIDPLLILSAWALAGIIAMAMAGILHPRRPGQPASTARHAG